ncbi:Dolichyl-diphosphooligosaccharide--protein glycosyltransferase subunit 3 [Grifola frondosa]|uniref:Dolichyl-diphosphooligosaccharide--protein glycosyltransferase subunit 3 n=1 Tax=Grifola frondosa TaxID=5627 RepID=A0A1C7MES5_GRIFR|nr:Dolichyl-diphosphooligosaccharide--protein glycosyltransferase subunit 3 [Grifola frondosa]
MLLPLLALLLAPLCLAAASTESTHAKLVQLAASNNGIINLDEHSYNMLTSPERTWSAAIHLTAMDPRRRSGMCREFEPSFNAVAKAWTKVPPQDRDSHFFATVDFDTGMAIFQKLGLQSAPVVQVHLATEGPRPANGRTAPISYDFAYGFDPAPLAEQLSQYTPVPIPYKAPVDWARIASYGATALVAVTAIRFLAPVLRSRWTWAAGTVLTSLIMTSGYMFVRIRGMPNSGANNQWIAPGYQNQFGQETQVVAMIYGLLASAFLMLTVITPYQVSPHRQRLQIYLWNGVIFIMFSVLISLFRVKNRGYPFKLLL